MNGLGGLSSIKWLLPDLLIKIGGLTLRQHVGVVEKGDFEFLVGNDLT